MKKIGFSKKQKFALGFICLICIISLIIGIIFLSLNDNISGWSYIFFSIMALVCLFFYYFTLNYYLYNEKILKVKNPSGKQWCIKWNEIGKIERKEITTSIRGGVEIRFVIFHQNNLTTPTLMLRDGTEILTMLKKYYNKPIFNYIELSYL